MDYSCLCLDFIMENTRWLCVFLLSLNIMFEIHPCYMYCSLFSLLSSIPFCEETVLIYPFHSWWAFELLVTIYFVHCCVYIVCVLCLAYSRHSVSICWICRGEGLCCMAMGLNSDQRLNCPWKGSVEPLLDLQESPIYVEFN